MEGGGGRPLTPLKGDKVQLKEWMNQKQENKELLLLAEGQNIIIKWKSVHPCLMFSTIAECCLKAITNSRSCSIVLSSVLQLRSYDDSTAVPVATMQRSLSCSVSALKTTLTLYPLCISSRQVPKVPTSSSTTCPRSLETRTYCRCSCLSEMWSLPKSSSTNRQTLASASVWQQHECQCGLPKRETHTKYLRLSVSQFSGWILWRMQPM